jgi:hypothetical protein
MKNNMNNTKTILFVAIAFMITACSDNDGTADKGFQVGTSANQLENEQSMSINQDSIKFNTRPSNVLLTGVSNIRLTTIYKVNIDNKDNSTFIGSNEYHYKYQERGDNDGNNWNNHLMPGLEAIYGYNLVNISHYDIKENKQRYFFEKPVLVKTLYYPSNTKDTLNQKPVYRDFFLVTVYDEDTNEDGFINLKDLRRMYLFNIKGERQNAFIPANYSVIKSEYDPDNDLMYVFAKQDLNNNGKQDESEPIHIFWINLNDPYQTGRQY